MSHLWVAGAQDLATVQRLLRMGRFVFCNVADEDLPGILARGATILAGERNAAWGVLVVDPETRPPTLPSGAPNRAQVRGMGLRHGPWLETAAPELVMGLRALLPPALLPLQVSVYITEAWLHSALLRAGFTQADTVVYYRLDLAPANAAQQDTAPGAAAADSAARLRPATLADMHALAELDAAAFAPLWHFGAAEIVELQVRGRVMLAEQNGEPVGYASLLLNGRRDAHLARLGVHPAAQGQGIGAQLLVDAVQYAQQAGCASLALNTQSSNLRSQALYRSRGFVPSGIEMPVLTLSLP